MRMAQVKLFPGVVEVAPIPEPEPLDPQTIINQQIVLLEDWCALASEIRRRCGDLPLDLAVEAAELRRRTNECLDQ
jgi:hypothetical protein